MFNFKLTKKSKEKYPKNILKKDKTSKGNKINKDVARIFLYA
jgi:hypothetical protein